MLRFIITILIVIFLTSLSRAQNVIIGTNGFLTKDVLREDSGFGIYTRLGVELYNAEIGIKSFYGNLRDLDSYGVSLYTFVPAFKKNKWELLGHMEGGFSFIYTDWGGSDRALHMGLGPAVRYRVREYFSFEFVLEYVVFANITTEAPLYTQVVIPTLGWSVRI